MKPSPVFLEVNDSVPLRVQITVAEGEGKIATRLFEETNAITSPMGEEKNDRK